MMVLIACIAVVSAYKVHEDRRVRAFRVEMAWRHLDAAAEHHRLEAKLLAEARTKTGYEAVFLKNDANYVRLQAEAEEKVAAAVLKETGIDPASLLTPKRRP